MALQKLSTLLLNYFKGVVHTHGSLAAQMDGMTQAWEWKSTDVILHTLPLHHIHGIVNVLMTPLYNGAKCIMLPKFNAEQVSVSYLSMSPTRKHRDMFVFSNQMEIFKVFKTV